MRLALIVLAAIALAACGGGSDSPPAPTATVPATATETPAPTSTPDRVVTIAAVGDLMLARDITTLMDEHGSLYPFERVAGLLMNADITIANMEGTFTERGIAADKLYTFRTPPRHAAGLAEAGIDVVSLGNNHTADFGPEGVEDTLAALDTAGVLYAGAGMDEAQARRAAFVEAEGLRIAVLSYTDILENTFAGPSTPGVAFGSVEAISADVRAARAQADVVVVSLHSGIEYTDAPDVTQQTLARAAVDAGATLVLGSHPHALQGWEWYGDGIIVYSLGNFVFDLDADDLENLGERAFQSIVFYVTLDGDRVVEAHAEPVFIDVAENRPRPATPEEASAILARLDELDAMAGGP